MKKSPVHRMQLPREVLVGNGILKSVIEFGEGLNILSGENGTCKTQVLIEIKAGKNIQSSDASVPRIQAFSPKRNA